jgi:ABC-type polysaccharide/polyol phosphate transport system ATPase subunit
MHGVFFYGKTQKLSSGMKFKMQIAIFMHVFHCCIFITTTVIAQKIRRQKVRAGRKLEALGNASRTIVRNHHHHHQQLVARLEHKIAFKISRA